MNNRYWLIGFLLLGVFCSVGLVIKKQHSVANESPSVLRVGVLPDEDAEVLLGRYSDLLAYLSQQTGIQTQLVIPKNYQQLVNLFESRELDLANFGGLTFLRSKHADALVMRDVDAAFSSYFISSSQNPLNDLKNFEGGKLSFGSKLSTSGHLMPRYFMEEIGISVETFFDEIKYSGAHDKTILEVINGRVDVGAVNAEVLKEMVKRNRIQLDDFNIVWQTPPYVDYVWAVQSDLEENLKITIRNAFLLLDKYDEEQGEILDRLGASYFIPTGYSDFINLRSIAFSEGLLGK